jgi:hypothetical protein
MNVKFVIAKQAKESYQYRNIKKCTKPKQQSGTNKSAEKNS